MMLLGVKKQSKKGVIFNQFFNQKNVNFQSIQFQSLAKPGAWTRTLFFYGPLDDFLSTTPLLGDLARKFLWVEANPYP